MKKWICIIFCTAIMLSFSGCLGKILVMEPTQRLIEDITYDIILDIMAEDDWMAEDNLAALEITSETDASPFIISEYSTLSAYTQFVSSTLAQRIAGNMVRTSLPKSAMAIYTYKLLKNPDKTALGEKPSLICQGTLWQNDNYSYFTLEFNDERIEEHCYYLPLKNRETTYLIQLAEGKSFPPESFYIK